MKHYLRLGLVVLLLVWAGGQSVRAQQMPQLSQYMNNNFLINPAVAGTENFTEVKFSHRTQWLGLEGAPKTYYTTIHTALAGRRRTLRQYRQSFSAVGGLVYADVTGPTSRTGAYFSFAHNVPLTRQLRLAVGASVGVQQFAIDGQQLRFHDPDGGLQGSMAERLPDATVGIWLYGSSFYAGASVAQILGSKLDLSFRQAGAASLPNSLQPHYYFTGGLRVPLTPNWTLVPSMLLKVTATAPAAVDFNLRLRYQKIVWAGASLRWSDAAVAMVGINLTETTNVTYSYDMGISSLNTFHSGSHELLLGLRLAHQGRAGSRPGGGSGNGPRNRARYRSRSRGIRFW